MIDASRRYQPIYYGRLTRSSTRLGDFWYFLLAVGDARLTACSFMLTKVFLGRGISVACVIDLGVCKKLSNSMS